MLITPRVNRYKLIYEIYSTHSLNHRIVLSYRLYSPPSLPPLRSPPPNPSVAHYRLGPAASAASAAASAAESPVDGWARRTPSSEFARYREISTSCCIAHIYIYIYIYIRTCPSLCTQTSENALAHAQTRAYKHAHAPTRARRRRAVAALPPGMAGEGRFAYFQAQVCPLQVRAIERFWWGVECVRFYPLFQPLCRPLFHPLFRRLRAKLLPVPLWPRDRLAALKGLGLPGPARPTLRPCKGRDALRAGSPDPVLRSLEMGRCAELLRVA